MSDAEIFATEVYDDVVVTEVIRPAAVVPESSARTILVELALDDVQLGGSGYATRRDGHVMTGHGAGLVRRRAPNSSGPSRSPTGHRASTTSRSTA